MTTSLRGDPRRAYAQREVDRSLGALRLRQIAEQDDAARRRNLRQHVERGIDGLERRLVIVAQNDRAVRQRRPAPCVRASAASVRMRDKASSSATPSTSATAIAASTG